VEGDEPGHHGHHEVDRHLRGEALLAQEGGLQVEAAQEGLDEEGLTARRVDARVEGGDHVGVADTRRRGGLAFEAGADGALASEPWAQGLHRDGGAVVEGDGLVHHAVAPAAEERLEAVPPMDDVPDAHGALHRARAAVTMGVVSPDLRRRWFLEVMSITPSTGSRPKTEIT